MEGKGDSANPQQHTQNFQSKFKRKFPSQDHYASESIDGPTGLKHKLTRDMEKLKLLRSPHLVLETQKQERALDKMLASYEEAIAILNEMAREEQDQGQGDLVSSRPPDDSDHSSMAASASMDPNASSRKLTRRKVTVSKDNLDDGYSWRKYGQKYILGSKYPRDYYRCTKSLAGCPAKKHVQGSDGDPTIFEVWYSGKHKCEKRPGDASDTCQQS